MLDNIAPLRQATPEVLASPAHLFTPPAGIRSSPGVTITWMSKTAPVTARLEILDSALYKALNRLEDAGAVQSEWGASENNRRAKYYALTAKGRKQLRAEVAGWKHYVATVNSLLEPG